MLKYYSLILILFFSFIVSAQETQKNDLKIEPIQGATPWTSLDLNNRPGKFHFAIVTDRTGGHRPGIFMDAVHKLNLLQPEFVMSVGDLIEGYTTDIDELTHQWDEFDGFINELDMPFFYIPGNHDITNQVMEDLWKKRLGPTYYHFVYKDVLFLALNSEDQKRGAGKGTISDAQFEYVKKVLSENTDVKWTLLFMHQPLWNQEDTKRWEEVEQLLKNRKHTVYTGHEHRYVKYHRNNGNYYVLATTGGASGLRGPKMGEFDHVVWITMTDDGPIMANIHLDGIYDDAVFTDKMRAHVERMATNNPFQITPLYIDDNMFEEGELEIKITNDENIPMRVVFEEHSSMDLIGVLDKKEVIVPPNFVEKVNLTLSKRFKSFNEPIQLDAEVFFTPLDVPTGISYPYRFNLKPLPKYPLKRTSQKMKIDGKAKDWTEFPFSYKGDTEETQVSFNLLYDEKYLYFGAKVKDDTVVSYGNGAVWVQDNVGISISALPLSKSAMSEGRNWYKDEYTQLASPENDMVKSVYYRHFIKNNTMVCKQTENGFFAEMKLPISYIEEKQGKNWKTIRVEVVIDDKDGKEVKRYYWQPTWMNKEINVIGSGMFFKK